MCVSVSVCVGGVNVTEGFQSLIRGYVEEEELTSDGVFFLFFFFSPSLVHFKRTTRQVSFKKLELDLDLLKESCKHLIK